MTPSVSRALALLTAMITATLLVVGQARAETPSLADAAPELAVDHEPTTLRAPGVKDPDNCLLCHRFSGLSRLDDETGEIRLFFVSERFHADGAGPHTDLACTACHTLDAFEKVPHDEATAVDCTQACHLVSSSGTPLEFSHERPARSLAESVHAPDVLAGQPYGVPLLREGQSACLFCHDDPVYRMPPSYDAFHRGVDPTVRCRTCHDDSLPVDIERALHHVGSRIGDQRPAREAARACAVCHSDEALNEANGQHDAVTSYFRSFHGKATALGSLDAPICSDCHASEDGDAHLMLAAVNPLSPTHPDNTQLTCRNAGCHDDAAPALSAAGVHMRISPDAQTFEYYVMAGFLILTAGTMSLYFLLLLLELVHMIFRRQDDETRELVALARAVQGHTEGRKRISRLTVHQRFQHWVLVASFMLLVVTGLPMKFASVEWMPLLVQVFGGLENVRLLHRGAALVIVAVSVYHLGYLAIWAWSELKRRREQDPERGLVKHLALIVWEAPMMLRPKDISDFALLFAHLFGLRKHRPAQGRFHFSQKFEYWAVFWGMTMIGVSGAMLWMEDLAAATFGGRALNFAYIVHSDEAFLALIYIVVVHFFAVVFSPSVFPINLGSLTGDMPPGELAENHIGHLREVAAELGITATPAPRATGGAELVRQLGRRGYAVVQFVVIATVAYFSLSFLLHELVGGEKAINVDKVPLRLDASVLEPRAATDDVGTGGASKNPLDRGPLAHFHAIPTWQCTDTGNSCTTGGCHSALPHGERKEVRAFLNMHTTFVDCQVCHRDTDLRGVELNWLTLDDRSPRPAPAVLRLSALLGTDPPAAAARPAPWDTELLETLREAVEDSGDDPELTVWLVELESSRVGGPRYSRIVESMRARIDRHGHGEYGARLGLAASTGRLWTPTEAQQAAIERVRGPEGSALRVDERKALVTTIHETLKKPEVECSLCHTDEGGLVVFEELGYSPQRAQALRSNTVARQSQAVESGRTFFMPSVLRGAEPPEEPTADPEVKP